MHRKTRSWLSYANIVSTLCLFVVLGGGAYAASKISGSELEQRSVSGNRLKKHTVTQTEVKVKTLTAFMNKKIDFVFNDGPVVPGTGGGTPQIVDVNCPAGERAIGGGGAWIISNFQDNNVPTALASAWISASMPIPARPGTDDATGWRVAGRNITNTNRNLRAYAVCVKQPQ